MEKWMIVYVLPLEVWMDIFCFPWISRKEFGQIVDRIGNFKFIEHAQFYLHEWGKRTLCDVIFNKNGLCIDDDELYLYLDIPQTPLPPNIRYLGDIQIDHFDANTIDFLGKIRPLLTDLLEVDVSDILPNCLEDLRTILSNLVPFVDGIHKLQCSEDTLPIAKQCFSREKLDKLKILQYWFHLNNGAIDDEAKLQEHVILVMDWLLDNNNDEPGPRLCAAQLCDNHGYAFLKQISTAIRQQFLTARTPCAFALKMDNDFNMSTLFAEFHEANGRGEELHGTWTGVGAAERFQIVRHMANCNKGMQEWIKHTENASIGCIYFNYPTIGLLDDAAQVGVRQVGEEQDDQQQQPCSSKDV